MLIVVGDSSCARTAKGSDCEGGKYCTRCVYAINMNKLQIEGVYGLRRGHMESVFWE